MRLFSFSVFVGKKINDWLAKITKIPEEIAKIAILIIFNPDITSNLEKRVFIIS